MHNDNNSFYSIGRFIYYFTLGIIDSLVRGLFTTENNNMNDSSKLSNYLKYLLTKYLHIFYTPWRYFVCDDT